MPCAEADMTGPAVSDCRGLLSERLLSNVSERLIGPSEETAVSSLIVNRQLTESADGLRGRTSIFGAGL